MAHPTPIPDPRFPMPDTRPALRPSCFFLLAPCFFVLLLPACAQHQFIVEQPPGLAAPLRANQMTVLNYPPLEYRLFNTGSPPNEHLLVRITNPTDQPLRLIAERSYVLDPAGGSHPVFGGPIPPHSYLHLPLPPFPQYYTVPQPGYYGWGYGWGGPYYGGGFYDPYWYPATYRYYTPYDWTWNEGQARVHLTYEQENAIIEHDLVIRREKVPRK